jgi:hypothetical protein
LIHPSYHTFAFLIEQARKNTIQYKYNAILFQLARLRGQPEFRSIPTLIIVQYAGPIIIDGWMDQSLQWWMDGWMDLFYLQ